MRTRYLELTEAEAAAVEHCRKMEYNLVVLSNQELNKVEEYRAQFNAWLHNLEVQHLCGHNWRWLGSGQNDDAYECTKCGLTKYE